MYDLLSYETRNFRNFVCKKRTKRVYMIALPPMSVLPRSLLLAKRSSIITTAIYRIHTVWFRVRPRAVAIWNRSSERIASNDFTASHDGAWLVAFGVIYSGSSPPFDSHQLHYSYTSKAGLLQARPSAWRASFNSLRKLGLSLLLLATTFLIWAVGYRKWPRALQYGLFGKHKSYTKISVRSFSANFER